MRNFRWITCFFLVLFYSGLSYAAQYKYFIKVVSPPLHVYSSPSFGSKIVAKGAKGQVFEISEKKNKWMRVKVRLARGGFIFGWVEVSASKYKVYRKTMKESNKSAARPAPKKTVTSKKQKKPTKPRKKRSTSGNNAFREASSFAFRAMVGPVYSIKDYFSESSLTTVQWRGGLGIDRILTEKIWVSIPVLFTMGQGFKTVGAGVNGYFSPLDFGSIMPYAKLGATYEYLFSGSNSFHAANIEAGLGLDYVFHDKISVGIEPLSMQAMVYRSVSDIPNFNIRGQLLLTARVKW